MTNKENYDRLKDIVELTIRANIDNDKKYLGDVLGNLYALKEEMRVSLCVNCDDCSLEEKCSHCPAAAMEILIATIGLMENYLEE